MTRTISTFPAKTHPPLGALANAALGSIRRSVDTQSSLDEIGVVMRFERDQAIFYVGDDADYYYKVVDGLVRLSDMLADGRRQIIDFVKPSHYFGFSSQKEHLFQAEAVSDVTLVRYARRRVDTMVVERPSVARLVVDITNDSLRGLQRQLVLLGRRTAKERLVAFLLDFAKSAETDSRGFFQLPMSRRDIADYLGLTIETVSRIFSELKRDRDIELAGSHEVALRRAEELALLIE